MNIHFRKFLHSNPLFYSLLGILCVALLAALLMLHTRLLHRYREMIRGWQESGIDEACWAACGDLLDQTNDIFEPHARALSTLRPVASDDSLRIFLNSLEKLPGILHAYCLESGSRLITREQNSARELRDALTEHRGDFAAYSNGCPKYTPKFDSQLRNRVRFVNIPQQGDTLRMILCAYDGSGAAIRILPAAAANPLLIAHLIALQMDPQWLRQSVAAHLEQALYNREALWWWSPPISAAVPTMRGLGVIGLGDTLWWSGLKSAEQGQVRSMALFPSHPWFQFRTVFADSPDDIAMLDAEIGAQRTRLWIVDGLAAGLLLLLMILLVQVRRQWQARQTALSHLTHALRTPAARLRLNVDTVQGQRTISPDEESHLLQGIANECGRIERAVQNAALSLDRGARTVDRIPGDLAQIVQDAIAPWEISFRSEGIVFEQVGSPVPLRGLFDREMIVTVVDNLLDNALRHTRNQVQQKPRSPQRAKVSLRSENGWAVLTVEDSDGGVPEADRKRIFHRFERGSNTALAGVTGLGLGLALVKDIVTSHSGRVVVDDSRLGGARFMVHLPLQNK